MIINSKKNDRFKNWKKLQSVKGRKQFGQYLIESPHLVEEAIKYSQAIEEIIVSERYYETNTAQCNAMSAQYPMTIIGDDLASDLAMTKTTTGIFAILTTANSVKLNYSKDRYLLVDNVQDPGNLGTLIRTADAAGYDGVILGEGTVDVLNDKVQRAAQGSQWHLPIIHADLLETIATLADQGVSVLASALHQQSVHYTTMTNKQKLAIIVGNEGRGVSKEVMSHAHQLVHISMPGKAESLNVAVAAGILMFHFVKS